MRVEFAQVFTQIISFLIVLWVLKRYAWKPFLKILDDREKKIRDEFAAIEKTKQETDALKQDYEKQLQKASADAKELIQKARESGIELAEKIERDAHAEATRILNQAQEQLGVEVIKAKQQLKDELVKITLTATEKMMKTSMDQEKQKALVREFVEKAGAS